MSSDQEAIVVVAAVIVQDDKVLIQQRHSGPEPSTIGKWEFPGGVVHFGEPLEDALSREVAEELGHVVDIQGLLHAQINTYDSGTDWLVLFYECAMVGRVTYLLEANPRFVDVFAFPEALCLGVPFQYPMLPGSIEAVEVLKMRHKRDKRRV